MKKELYGHYNQLILEANDFTPCDEREITP